jgi:2,3-bisphosphoglycerate-independent phosphoglycerate mutase
MIVESTFSKTALRWTLQSMDFHDLIKDLKESNDGKIVMLVADGIGGLPMKPGGLTELEPAKSPNLDA